MTSMDDNDRQGRTGDKATTSSIYGAPLFYSDQHARFLLGLSPRYLNVFTYRPDVPGAEVRHIPGPAHSSHALAVVSAHHKKYGAPAYRIVVKPKRVSA